MPATPALDGPILSLFEGTAQPTLLVDPRHAKVLMANPTAAALIGMAREDAVGLTIDQLFTGPDRTSISDLIGMGISLPLQQGYLCRGPGGESWPCDLLISRVEGKGRSWAWIQVLPGPGPAEGRFEAGRLSLDPLPAGALILDHDGRILQANAAFLAETGWGRDELVGASPPHRYWPDGPDERMRGLFGIILAGRASGAYSVTLRRADDALLETLWRVRHLDGTGGLPAGWLVLVMNITEQKRSENSVRASEQRFRLMCANSPVGIVLAEANGEWKWVNNYARDAFGAFAEQLLGQGWMARLYPEDRGRVHAEWRAASNAGRAYQATFRLRAGDGLPRWVRYESRPILNDDGRPQGHTALVEDVTERRRLAEHQRRLTEIIEATSDIVSFASVEGRVLYVNQAGRNLAAPGTENHDLTIAEAHPDWAAQLIREVGVPTAIRDGSWTGETALRLPDGEMPTSQVIIAHRNPMGQAEYLSTIIRDISDQKRDQREIEAQARFISSVARAVPDVIYVIEPGGAAGRTLYSSRAVASLLGYTDDAARQFGGGPPAALIHPDDAGRLPEARATWAANPGDEVFEWEARYRRPEGTYAWLSIREAAFRRSTMGEALEVVGLARDVSERKRLEEASLAAQADRDRALDRLETLINQMPIGCVTTDADLRVVSWNRAMEQTFGFAAEEIVGTIAPTRVVPPDRVDEVRRMLELCRQGRDTEAYVARNVHKNGREVICEWHYVSMSDEFGRFGGLIVMAHDVTARSRAEDELRRREQLFRALVEKASDGFALLDQEFRFRHVGPNMAPLLGYPFDELSARNLRSIVHSDDLPKLFDADGTPTLSTRQPVRLLRHDGSVRDFEVEITDHLDDPAIRAYVFNCSDTTERIRLHEQLMQSQKLDTIGKLAGGIAHEFNNLLTIIGASAQELTDLIRSSDSIRRRLEAISSATARATDLTSRLLGFARKGVLKLQTLSPHQALVDAVRMLQPAIDRRVHIHVEDPPPGLPRIVADPNQISSVVVNLCVNARDAMPEGGNITLNVRKAEPSPIERESLGLDSDLPYVRIEVADDGSGIEPGVMSRVFEPFFTTKPQGKGTGLGLSMVYGIVKSHRGGIRVESEVGRGTKFTLFFPSLGTSPDLELPPEPIAVAASPIPEQPGRTVLVVDDEPSIRQLGKRILEGRGYRVLLAGDGADALETLDEVGTGVDLVVLDLTMPEMSGHDLFREIRKRWPLMAVLFSSGYSPEQLEGDAADEPFITKPYLPNDLANAVSSALVRRFGDSLAERAKESDARITS